MSGSGPAGHAVSPSVSSTERPAIALSTAAVPGSAVSSRGATIVVQARVRTVKLSLLGLAATAFLQLGAVLLSGSVGLLPALAGIGSAAVGAECRAR